MTATHNSGPAIVYGGAAGGSSAGSNPEAGPSVTYQGECVLDIRFPYQPGVIGLGKVRAFLDSPYELMVDAVPSQAQVANIAAAANVTSGSAMTLVASSASGVTAKVQILPAGATAPVSGLVSPDLGSTIGTMTAGSTNVSSVGTTQNLTVGQPVFVAGAGAGGGLLFTRVASVTSPTAFTTTDPAATSVTGGAIGTANDALTGPDPYLIAGHTRVFDPTQGLCRAISITGSASATGGAFMVRGYDIYSTPMEETVTAAAGATTTNGKKAFKFIASVTPQFTDAHNYSVGTADIFGFNLRSDKWEYVNAYWAGTFATVSTGWTAALAAGAAATANNADVRGTYATQSASDGSKRLALFTSIPLYNLTAATPTNPAPLFGNPQFFA